MKRFLAIAALALLVSAGALAKEPAPYNPQADAKAQVAQVLAEARANHKPVLLFFGANWCEDCRALAHDLAAGRNAQLMDAHFNIAKIDVGNFDHNLDVVNRFGNPIAKGIPAAVIVSPDGKLLYSTRAGELSEARSMSADGVYDFFQKAIQRVQSAG
ncbi:Thioredoxin superfamily protein isoform 1 [Dorcoceras hygrometricum]|jgi:protein disulfide-isomerase|uniref:Thioredoxin superfamily protein isoform 1 n=1 Tax=Dorcoceras hygrometricum TaxID=472368 RepID=A0A2Z7A837_9LAMI|nr:Thioredoxin superfamily protein isoform 1 [Dorcoceras hygrometricum]